MKARKVSYYYQQSELRLDTRKAVPWLPPLGNVLSQVGPRQPPGRSPAPPLPQGLGQAPTSLMIIFQKGGFFCIFEKNIPGL